MKARVAPTRSELLRSRRLLERVERGASLLRRKREALVRELFPIARPAAEARREIAAIADRAYRAELEALAMWGAGDVAATGWPPRTLEATVETEPVWGVAVPAITELPSLRRGPDARAAIPPATGPAVVEAADQFEELVDRLLDAASRELHLRALGEALARTSRQVQTLEHRVAPALRARIARASAALAEREREEHMRLRQLRKRAVVGAI